MCKIIDVRYCIAMILSCVRVVLILCLEMCNYSCKMVREDTCVVPLALVVMITIGGTFHPLLQIFFKKGHIFSSFLLNLFKCELVVSV